MKISLSEILANIPGKPSAEWPQGERYTQAFAHGSMSVGLYAPVGADPQRPHGQDELYIIRSGSAQFTHAGASVPCAIGDVLFVPARDEHRFLHLSPDFSAWVVFWGPRGGEESEPA